MLKFVKHLFRYRFLIETPSGEVYNWYVFRWSAERECGYMNALAQSYGYKIRYTIRELK